MERTYTFCYILTVGQRLSKVKKVGSRIFKLFPPVLWYTVELNKQRGSMRLPVNGYASSNQVLKPNKPELLWGPQNKPFEMFWRTTVNMEIECKPSCDI